jgi:hypothetical protein
MANAVVEKACRQVCLASRQKGTKRGEARRVFVLGESSFMPQQLTLVENGVGSRQR